MSARGDTHGQDPSPAERTVARRAAEARATIPDVELGVEVDMSGHAPDEPLTPLLVTAVARGLREVPRANGAYRDGRFELYSRVNVGVVLAREDGYAIPTVFDADTKSVAELGDEIQALRERAAEGMLAAPALSGATFTVWNAGELGVDHADAVVGPGQAAALVAGALREVPVVRDGTVVPGHAMTITLACDGRILYGVHAAGFLRAIKTSLQRR